MGRRLILTIEEADRGNVLRVAYTTDTSKAMKEELEIIEGQQGSVNLRDRTRRRVNELVSGYYPTDRALSSGS